MNITVYLGANEGNDPALKQAVEELGRWIGESGNGLVYGGSKTGLMGLLADSALSAGAEVAAWVVSTSAAIRFRATRLRRAMNTVPAKISADTSATTRRSRETGEFFRSFRPRGRYFPLFWLVMVNHPLKKAVTGVPSPPWLGLEIL